MKNKKIVSMIVMFSIFINIISGLHIDAQGETLKIQKHICGIFQSIQTR